MTTWASRALRKLPWIARIALCLLALACGASVVELSTRNDWDQVARCAGPSPPSGTRCVTHKQGRLRGVGFRTCLDDAQAGGSAAAGCEALPVDIRFSDGSRRRFTFGWDRDPPFVDRRRRDVNVVSDPAFTDDSLRVVGRFAQRRLVGLAFADDARDSFATDDYPGGDANRVAFKVMGPSWVLAIAAFFGWGLWHARTLED